MNLHYNRVGDFAVLLRSLVLTAVICSLTLSGAVSLPGEALAAAKAPAKTQAKKSVPAKKTPAKTARKSAKKTPAKKTAALKVTSLASSEERNALRERGISSGFGMRAISRKATRMHKGIDIPAPRDSKIVAYNDGKVIFAGKKNGYGNMVTIRQIDGREAIYAHMNKYTVKTGDTVRRGDHIGHVGRTGTATGYHLHFELVDNGENLDPALHVWHGSELVLGPGDLDPATKGTSVASPATKRQPVY